MTTDCSSNSGSPQEQSSQGWDWWWNRCLCSSSSEDRFSCGIIVRRGGDKKSSGSGCHKRNESTDTAKTSTSTESDALIQQETDTNKTNDGFRVSENSRFDTDQEIEHHEDCLQEDQLSFGILSASRQPIPRRSFRKLPLTSIFKTNGVYSQEKKHQRRGIIHQFSTVTFQRLQQRQDGHGRRVRFPSDDSKLRRVRLIPHHSTWTDDLRSSLTFCYPSKSWRRMLKINANQHRLEMQLRQLDEPNPEEFLETIGESCSSMDCFNGDTNLSDFAGGFLQSLDFGKIGLEKSTSLPQEENEDDKTSEGNNDDDDDDDDALLAKTSIEMLLETIQEEDFDCEPKISDHARGNDISDESRLGLLPTIRQRLSFKKEKKKKRVRSQRKASNTNDLPDITAEANRGRQSMFDLIVTKLED